MSAMEQKFSIRQEAVQEAAKQQQQHPEYSSEEYMTWLYPQLIEARNCVDMEKYIPMVFLSKLSEALMVNEDLRSKEALLFLKEVQEELLRDPDCSNPTGE